MLGETSNLFRRMEGPGNWTGEDGGGGHQGGAVAGLVGEEASGGRGSAVLWGALVEHRPL